jgi:hypothetical protein
MATVLDYLGEINALYTKVEELEKAIPSSLGYKLKTLLGSYHDIFERFCPYKVGDRVFLNKTPTIECGSGWYGSKHFLVKGAAGTIHSRDYCDGKFCFYVEWDDESWMDEKGEIHPIIAKHVFLFSEDWLVPQQAAEDSSLSKVETPA